MENLKTLLIKYLCENARYSVSQLASMTGADETAALATYLAARYNDMAAALARRPEADCAAVECVYAQ